MLAIQTYLRQHHLDFETLKEELGIKARTSPDYRLLLKYDKFDNKGYKYQETRECRGLILNYARDYEVLSYPFYKFFNHFEPLAATIDWTTARAYQKFDGTCISIYQHNGAWDISTLGSLDCEGPVNSEINLTFYDLVSPLFIKIASKLKPSYTYVFELCSKLNRIVTLYDHAFLKLILVRDAKTLEEIPIENFKDVLDIAPSTKVSSLEEVIEMANNLKNLEEGYVVKDAAGNRIKVKSDSYFSAFSIKNELGTSFGSMLKFIFAGNYEEFLHLFPEYRIEFIWYVTSINILIAEVKRIVNFFRTEDRAALAKAIKNYHPLLRHLCFFLLDHPKADLRQHLFQNLQAKPKSAKHIFRALTSLVGEPQWKRT